MSWDDLRHNKTPAMTKNTSLPHSISNSRCCCHCCHRGRRHWGHRIIGKYKEIARLTAFVLIMDGKYAERMERRKKSSKNIVLFESEPHLFDAKKTKEKKSIAATRRQDAGAGAYENILCHVWCDIETQCIECTELFSISVGLKRKWLLSRSDRTTTNRFENEKIVINFSEQI